MARINIDGEQNVEVSIKIPCKKSYSEQLEIMEAYTKAHRTINQRIRRFVKWSA